ncbi:hypothetical protein [Streptomyces sp. NPDC101776]|uniref:hypothetical protein n=1 Tax=Streptomyces sp. NPDC101776 TaxID=3366146 RepID=UPI0037FBAC91
MSTLSDAILLPQPVAGRQERCNGHEHRPGRTSGDSGDPQGRAEAGRLGIGSAATLKAAVSVLPMSAAMIPGIRLSPRPAARRGAHGPWSGGLLLITTGLLVLARLDAGNSYRPRFGPADAPVTSDPPEQS